VERSRTGVATTARWQYGRVSQPFTYAEGVKLRSPGSPPRRTLGIHFDFLNDDTLRAGLNRIEAGGEDFDNLRFSLPPGYTLVYDFDSGLAQNNTLSFLKVPSDLGFGVDEVNSYAGDSGGPAFIDGAVRSWATSVSTIATPPQNSSTQAGASWAT
jgi:hypothetical protein